MLLGAQGHAPSECQCGQLKCCFSYALLLNLSLHSNSRTATRPQKGNFSCLLCMHVVPHTHIHTETTVHSILAFKLCQDYCSILRFNDFVRPFTAWQSLIHLNRCEGICMCVSVKKRHKSVINVDKTCLSGAFPAPAHLIVQRLAGIGSLLSFANFLGLMINA